MSWYSDGEKFDEYDPPWCENCPHGDQEGDSYEECEACCRRHERKERRGRKVSVSLWRWSPECDEELCVGDCDLCGFEPEESEEEDDRE